MLRAIEWFCDWVDKTWDWIDHWAGRSPSRCLLIYLVGVGLAAAVIIIQVAIFTCLY